GVLDCLMDSGLLPKTAIGVSAGALNGFNYVAGARGRTCYLNTKYSSDWRYLSLRSYAVTGNALNTQMTFDEIPNKLEPFDYRAFTKSPLRLISVASDLDLGEADYKHLTEVGTQLAYLRASAAIPLLSQIVEVDGKRLLDGGTCDSVPIDYSCATGTTKHLVVLTQDAEYVKDPEKILPLYRHTYSDYPFYLDRLEYRHIDYNRCYRKLARMHSAGEAFVIRPPVPVSIASMERDPKKLYELWLLGYKEMQKNFKRLQTYLEL
ncbi:MAG: patatin family protein, partial [Candidatus Bathyarchaeota archaeon]|nr:patatin family protein [Candidatus Bathyarchaeota archaeon]